MARILVLCNALPSDPADGLHLRVHNLVAQVAMQHECYLLACQGADSTAPYDGLGIFRAHAALPERPTGGRSWRRHFRVSNARFLRLASPGYLAAIESGLEDAVRRWNIDMLVSFAGNLGEAGDALAIPRVLDYADSRTLTLERMLGNPHSDLSRGTRLKRRLDLLRVRGRERSLVRRHDYTTTISESDRAALLRVSGVPANRVRVVPNGVSAAALHAGATAPADVGRSVAFWGNLDFPPNRTAVRYFLHEVFVPYLAAAGVTWHIAGRLGDEHLRRELDHPQIRLHGFVEDLFGFVRQQGVMVNPMVEGSGLKNKVLEAFALRVPVVSTPLGIEAIDCRPETHYLPAPDPGAFAEAVLRLLDDPAVRSGITAKARALVEARYSWDAVGQAYRAFLDAVLEAGHEARGTAEAKRELRYEPR